MSDSAFNPTSGTTEKANSIAAVQLEEDRMTAYLVITEPFNGGEEITLADAMREIEASPVKVEIDQATINRAINGKIYGQRIPIAKGIRPINGIDGHINYRFECSGILKARKNEKDEMNYKDLGLVQNILAGTVIADISLPTQGEDGIDVCGNHHKAMPGKEAKYLVGKGTELNENKTCIITAADGNLRWHRDHFTVDEVLIIPEDVGAETGNIDFIGDVQVKGNVFEGFSVSSKKNITINGSANNATVNSEGDINIKLGCVNSVINSKGNIKIGFCESSTINCGGDLSSASFVACDVFCEGTLNATSGKGVIVGGKMTCIKGMVFNTAGSESYTKTRLTLGNGAILSEEKLALEKDEAKITENIGGLVRLIEGLNAIKKKQGSLPRQHEDQLANAIRTRFKLSNEIKRIRKRVAEIEASFLDNASLKIEVRKIVWPGVTVRIGEQRRQFEHKHDRCRIGISDDGGIHINPIVGSI
jgi:uncharacterized protein (DUF342 family)